MPFDHHQAHIVGRLGEGQHVRHDRVEDFLRRPLFDFTDRPFQPVRKVVVVGAAAVLGDAVGVEQEDVALSHDHPLVHLVPLLETQQAFGPLAVGHVKRRQHAERRERHAQVVAHFHEAIVLVREDGRERLRGREEPEPRVLGDLSVDHRHELVRARRLVEPRVQVLEEPARDLAVGVQLVDRPEQERLVEHRRDERVGDAMARDVENRDPGGAPAAQQVLYNLAAALLVGLLDAPFEIEPLFEIDVDQVIAPDDAVQGEGAAVDVEA